MAVCQDDKPSSVDYRSDLLALLEHGKAPGDFAVGGQWTEAPMPGLRVEGFDGVVAVPVHSIIVAELSKVSPLSVSRTAATARLLSVNLRISNLPTIQLAHKARFGKGGETILDENVRKTLEIDANKVTLTNPRWEGALTKLVATVASGLGRDPGSTRANLYKLLLYEPGGFFKPHRDTEKEQGMFGTLVRDWHTRSDHSGLPPYQCLGQPRLMPMFVAVHLSCR
jgi:hypothetical protein